VCREGIVRRPSRTEDEDELIYKSQLVHSASGATSADTNTIITLSGHSTHDDTTPHLSSEHICSRTGTSIHDLYFVVIFYSPVEFAELKMVPSLPSFVVRPFTRGVDVARGTLGSLTWGPALTVAKPAILSVFSKIEIGTLLLVDEPSGTRMVYGQKLNSKLPNGLTIGDHPVRRADTIPRVEIVVKNEAFWMRLFLFADMGFAESYMLGEFECADLTAFFQVG
jgi:hypothetical protein